jgi:DNA-3-methyladenine glycosylase
MMNIVTGKVNEPQAVLIRGVKSVSGPGRVTRAMGIDGSYNGEDLTVSPRIWLEDTGRRPELKAGPRVGIGYAGEPWVSMPWRFITEDKIG